MRFIQKSCLIVLWILVGIILRAQPRMFIRTILMNGKNGAEDTLSQQGKSVSYSGRKLVVRL